MRQWLGGFEWPPSTASPISSVSRTRNMSKLLISLIDALTPQLDHGLRAVTTPAASRAAQERYEAQLKAGRDAGRQ
jgi:hypothetical protein